MIPNKAVTHCYSYVQFDSILPSSIPVLTIPSCSALLCSHPLSLSPLSCVTLMQLAPLHLPSSVNGAVQFFCLFELFNACQSFALGVTLAGGQDDTPLDLVSDCDWECDCDCDWPFTHLLSSPLITTLNLSLLSCPVLSPPNPTPQQVKWKAWLRALRFLIDLGCFVLRLVLWVQYNALSSVFLIKNLYNLLHTYAQIER